jgi:hypothetical protein
MEDTLFPVPFTCTVRIVVSVKVVMLLAFPLNNQIELSVTDENGVLISAEGQIQHPTFGEVEGR